MEVWISDISDISCYTRFGKVIPKRETKVDIEKFFNKARSEEGLLAACKGDKNIRCIVHNANVEIEKKAAAKKVENMEKEKDEKKEPGKNAPEKPEIFPTNYTTKPNIDLKKILVEKGISFPKEIKRTEMLRLLKAAK